MKSARIFFIFLGFLCFSQSLESQIEEQEENKKCCKFTQNNGVVNCTQLCQEDFNSEPTTTSDSAENQKKEVVEEEIKPHNTVSLFSSITTVCREGFRLDSHGHCRKVLSPRTKPTTTTATTLNIEA